MMLIRRVKSTKFLAKSKKSFSKTFSTLISDMNLKKRTIALDDNRTLCYREYGDTDNSSSYPIIFSHGNLNSRNFMATWDKTEEDTKKLNIRVIAVDRPGYGGSSFNENGSYKSFANDIRQLVEILNLDQFSFLGYSSGGPYSLSVAELFEENKNKSKSKLRSIGLISSDGPYKELEKENLGIIQKIYGFDVSKEELRTSQAEKNAKDMAEGYNTMKKLDRKELALSDLNEATIQGYKGPGYDAYLETNDWNIQFEKIKVPVNIYHGTNDETVPDLTSKYLETKLKMHNNNVRSYYIEGENHTLIRRKWTVILSALQQL